MRKPSPPKWYANLPRVIFSFAAEELRRGTLLDTLALSLKRRKLKFAEPLSTYDLLRRRNRDSRDSTFIYFDGNTYTFGDINNSVDKIAERLADLGFAPGDGVALMLENSPDFVATYMATQKIGLYAVPVNTALVGDSLAHIIGDSRVRGIVVDEERLPALRACGILRHGKPACLVRRKPSLRQARLPQGCIAFTVKRQAGSALRAYPQPRADDVSTILYTSGTTGLAKGVVYKYGNDWLHKALLLNRLIYKDDDVLYTCLPLFHANALFLTLSAGLGLGLPVVLSRRFSAAKFWDEVSSHKATVFNAIGAMIPILLKNPPTAGDRDNAVRLVLSAACPADAWRAFEARFGVTIWEGYSAVDGGQNFIFNFGNAPVGSFGKMSLSKYRIIDDNGRDVPPLTPGELVFPAEPGTKAVEYFRNLSASREKTRNGIIHTGDLVYRDNKGFLYFVGRNSDSLRRRGENISAHEVESAILKSEAVLECAVYGVPAEFGEQDVMCALVKTDGHKLDPATFIKWMETQVPRFALPRYVRIMDTLPKTPTHRVMKHELVKDGVTPDTYDAERSGRRKTG